MNTVKFAVVAAAMLAASALSTAAFAGSENLTVPNRAYFGGTVLNPMPEAAPVEAAAPSKHHGKYATKHAAKKHAKKHAKKVVAPAVVEEKK